MPTTDLPFSATEDIEGITEHINPIDGTLEFSRVFHVAWTERFNFAQAMISTTSSVAEVEIPSDANQYPGFSNALAYDYALDHGYATQSGKPDFDDDDLIRYDMAVVVIKYRNNNFQTLGALKGKPTDDPTYNIKVEISTTDSVKNFSIESGQVRNNERAPVKWKQMVSINIGYTKLRIRFPEMHDPNLEAMQSEIGTVNFDIVTIPILPAIVGGRSGQSITVGKAGMRYDGFTLNTKVGADNVQNADISFNFSLMQCQIANIEGVKNAGVLDWNSYIDKVDAEKDADDNVQQPYVIKKTQTYGYCESNTFSWMPLFIDAQGN